MQYWANRRNLTRCRDTVGAKYCIHYPRPTRGLKLETHVNIKLDRTTRAASPSRAASSRQLRVPWGPVTIVSASGPGPELEWDAESDVGSAWPGQGGRLSEGTRMRDHAYQSLSIISKSGCYYITLNLFRYIIRIMTLLFSIMTRLYHLFFCKCPDYYFSLFH